MKTNLRKLCWVCRCRIIATFLLLLTALKAFGSRIPEPPPPAAELVEDAPLADGASSGTRNN